MNKLRLIVIALAGVCALVLGVLALARMQTDPVPSSGPVIIIKGGSLTIDCDYDDDCLDHTAKGKWKHKKDNNKITQIVVTPEVGPPVTFDQSKFPHGKATIEITYEPPPPPPTPK